MTRAILRGVAASFARALCSAAPARPIDVELARRQHAAYRAALEAMGVGVTLLEPDDDCPDCCFVEDTAVVAEGVALITRPGAPSRRAETASVAVALAPHVEIARMTGPATLDGGDCLRLGSTIYVGRSARTNAAGIARLAEVFAPRGLRVVPIELSAGVLHLKCVCSPLGGDRLLLARDTLSAALFPGADFVWAPVEETYAANAVAVGSRVLIAADHPRTRDALEAAGFTTYAVATSEACKMDGSLTCQSILY